MKKSDCWYGIYPIKFIWHGAWSDPELKYKGHLFNYWDIENRMYEEWLYYYSENYPTFEDWITNNGKWVKAFLDYVIEIREQEN